MPLGRLVVAAKNNTPVMNPRKTLMNIIDAEKHQCDKKEEQKSWTECKYLKDSGTRASCTQFMSNCAKEKCKQHYRENDFFAYRKHLGKDIKKAEPVKGE